MIVIEARARDLGGFTIGRVLPTRQARSVGPFVLLDHMGPAEHAVEVLPHPHIGLATVTYLFEGEIVHRDSLGTRQAIRPGAINWMTAGRGIAHSERAAVEEWARAPRIHGLQLWVALPAEHEERAPSFEHVPPAAMAAAEEGGVRLRVLAGSAFGVRAPVATLSPLFYADVALDAGASLALPPPSEHAERAAYLVDGVVGVGAERLEPRRLAVFSSGETVLKAERAARVMLLGGAPLGPRHMWWNFVSSSRERIEQAKDDWRSGRFAKVAGDETDFVPLPAK
ncbi:MAG TPA: pirin family protein [Polyangia bacterium]|nr:pirin family protein [Polyangia bacterium]